MASLTVHVLDEDQDPISGKEVILILPIHCIVGTNTSGYTDKDGVIEFDDLPWNEPIEVHVDGECQLTTRMSEPDEDNDVTVTL